jgi:hypothetical protein
MVETYFNDVPRRLSDSTGQITWYIMDRLGPETVYPKLTAVLLLCRLLWIDLCCPAVQVADPSALKSAPYLSLTPVEASLSPHRVYCRV